MKSSSRKVECYWLVDKNLLAESVHGDLQENVEKNFVVKVR